jgi:hypothetical protein
MKKSLTILFSLMVILSIAQERIGDGPKPVSRSPLACPSLVMTPVDGTVTLPSNLVESILGSDIQSYSNVTFSGLEGNPLASAGLFTGGIDAGIGIEKGIVLSSGFVTNAIGPNAYEGITGNLIRPGDAQLSALAGIITFDATVLEFDFVPNYSELYVEFVFGSEEYNEYVGGIWNDVFAFYLNGENIALVPNTTIPISINTINLDLNNNYFKNNEFYPGPFCNEMDGFTTLLISNGLVNPGQTNHIKLAIADGYDRYWDSWVFIKERSFSGVNPKVPISNWALIIGIGLIIGFAVLKFRKVI